MIYLEVELVPHLKDVDITLLKNCFYAQIPEFLFH